jgi:hypothetical protein
MKWSYILAALLMGHHYLKHSELELPDRLYQVKDAFKPDSHEFWENVLFLVGVLTSY